MADTRISDLPPASAVQDTDLFVIVQNGVTKKASGAIVKPGTIGPQGVQGLTGPIGPQGIQGPPGPQGLTGPVGPIGPQGNPGVAGSVGPVGPQGGIGPQGPAGTGNYFSGTSYPYDINANIPSNAPEGTTYIQYNATYQAQLVWVKGTGAVLNSASWNYRPINGALVPPGTFYHFDVTADGLSQTFTNAAFIGVYNFADQIALFKNGNIIQPTVDYSYNAATGTITVLAYLKTNDSIDVAPSGGVVGSASYVQLINIQSANGITANNTGTTTNYNWLLGTNVTGLVKGNGTAFSAAVAGTDYLAPPTGTAILKANAGGALANAVAGTDYIAPPTGTAILKANAGGALANAVAGTDYIAPPTGTAILKANAGGALANAVVGTDYSAPILVSGSAITSLVAGTNVTFSNTGGALTINSTGGGGGVSSLNTLTGAVVLAAGANVTLTPSGNTITIAATGGGGGGSGTVTTVSVASANGFAGTVANPTTTPAITLTTSITGVLRGNGTAISAAVAGTDYQAPITTSTALSAGAISGSSFIARGSTSGTITFAAPATAGTQSYTLPAAVPTLNGQVLTATTGGVMTWTTPSSGPSNGLSYTNANVASTANITSPFTGTPIIDGYQTAAGNIVLIKDQTDQTQNGLYEVAAGTWTRTSTTIVPGLVVIIGSGTSNGGDTFVCSNIGTITIGSTNITFIIFSENASPSLQGVTNVGSSSTNRITSAGLTLNASLIFNGSTSGTITFAAPATAGTQTYTLPTANPTVDGQVLSCTQAGVMSWVANGVSQIVAGTNVTISPVGGTGVVTINATGGGGGGTAVAYYTGSVNTTSAIATDSQINAAIPAGTAFNNGDLFMDTSTRANNYNPIYLRVGGTWRQLMTAYGGA